MKRKIGHTATSIVLAGIAGMTTLHITACAPVFKAADATTNMATDTTANKQVPTPKLARMIDFKKFAPLANVRIFSFSPDSRYMAIVVEYGLSNADIVVWDMEKGKPQSRIHCPFCFGRYIHAKLLWSRDGKAIMFGAKEKWDPMTGEALPDNPVIGDYARLNKDGTKMLTLSPSYVRVYDTQTWEVQSLSVDGFNPRSAAWTADDKIVVAATIEGDPRSRTINGYQPKSYFDVALLLLDPMGKEPMKTKWFPAALEDDTKRINYGFPIEIGSPNFPLDKIFCLQGLIIDGKTLSVTRNVSYLKKTPWMAFSPDGQWLYVRGEAFLLGGDTPFRISIVAIDSGRVVGQFGKISEEGDSIATSPDGLSLALGLGGAVEIYRIQ